MRVQNNDQRLSMEDVRTIESEIDNIFSQPGASYDDIAKELEQYFQNGPFDDDIIRDIDSIIYENRPDYFKRTAAEMIDSNTFEQKYIRNLQHNIDGVINAVVIPKLLGKI